MVIFESKNKFFDKSGRKILEGNVTLECNIQIPSSQMSICINDTFDYTKLKSHSIEERNYCNYIICLRKGLLNNFALDFETIKIIHILTSLNLLQNKNLQNYMTLLYDYDFKLACKANYEKLERKLKAQYQDDNQPLEQCGVTVEHQIYSLNINRLVAEVFRYAIS